METSTNSIDRRNLLKILGLGTAGTLSLGLFGGMNAYAADAGIYETPNYAKGMAPVTITGIKVFATKPSGSNLIVVKVETSEPGLYGIGCATFTQRAKAVIAAIESYMGDFVKGKDVDNIEDLWQSFYVSSYWRNGPVLNNALSGLDEALWDIKGKRANMPVYQLLGGKSRFAIPCYAHAGGSTPEAVAEDVQKFIERGYDHVRIQQGGYGATGTDQKEPRFRKAGYGAESDNAMNTGAYLRSVPKMFETVRKVCGDNVELLHDIHERVQPMDAIWLINNVEEYRPFFIEDPLSPENRGWWEELRESTNVPIAMGELFNNINEFLEPMTKHQFDYIRCHVSQIGGITPAMKVARLGEWFGIRTAWHGPGDTSPVGHAANCHIDMAIWNFGIQEGREFSEKERDVFPGAPTMKDGHMYVNEAPGLGIDINEKEAAKYPIDTRSNWIVRDDDGTIIRP